MYFDSLTVTALVIFVIFFAVFIKYCVMNICGMPDDRGSPGTPDKRSVKQEKHL